MSLRYALLALLTVEPMTGYDLAKRFESSVALCGTPLIRRFTRSCGRWKRTGC